jgi:hypothetical protein
MEDQRPLDPGRLDADVVAFAAKAQRAPEEAFRRRLGLALATATRLPRLQRAEGLVVGDEFSEAAEFDRDPLRAHFSPREVDGVLRPLAHRQVDLVVVGLELGREAVIGLKRDRERRFPVAIDAERRRRCRPTTRRTSSSVLGACPIASRIPGRRGRNPRLVAGDLI